MSASPKSTDVAHGDTMRARIETAFVAAAYGDALGWPNETRGKATPKKLESSPSSILLPWKRRTGGKYASHIEDVGAGTYSDDTQLIISLTRSYLVAANDWWKYFSEVELPFWTVYQQGGGGATLRAAKAWSEGNAPWNASHSQYFSAGGNGVAMRALPHVVRHRNENSFEPLRDAVVLDGITTHGHPRALLGATSFAFALWSLLRRNTNLCYGELIDETVNGINHWSEYPFDDAFISDKISSLGWHAPENYRELWSSVVDESRSFLSIAKNAISQGALFNDRPTLEKIGALGSFRGSGTVTSIAAIFLAARYAVDPTQGVVEAAFSAGADTDTLASMTATLLACVAEGEQLKSLAKDVQDYDYLLRISQDLTNAPHTTDRSEITAITANKLKQWKQYVLQSSVKGTVVFPDGREGEVQMHFAYSEKNLTVVDTTIKARDGQTFVLSHTHKKRETIVQPLMIHQLPAEENIAYPIEHGTYAYGLEILLRCKDIKKTVEFYERVLGLHVYESHENRVRFEGSMSFVEAVSEAEIQAQQFISVRVRVRGLPNIILTLRELGYKIDGDGNHDRSLPTIQVRDPDGRLTVMAAARL